MKTKFTSLIVVLLFILSVQAKEKPKKIEPRRPVQILTGCNPSTSHIDLDIGNVRARVLMNGDMWSDLAGNAKYEVPKNSGKYSLAAGAIWMGGYDAGINLKLAAQTYRQGTTGVAGSGNDFWPGPVDLATANVTPAVCTQYDRHWKITRSEVQGFVDSLAIGHTPAFPSLDFRQWPANGSAGQAQFLAPFHDANGDGIYDWTGGDYPVYDFPDSNSFCSGCNRLHGDQTIWWIFNDVGNNHTEQNANPIGLEIQAQAFAYNSGIPNLDNATFYSYKIINRSPMSLFQTYFGQWVDPDLGNPLDDYVACDVARGMGYCYNGDNNDDGPLGYGLNPPAVGVDFLMGPNADIGDGMDNDRDSCVDCTWVDSSGQMIAVPDYILPEAIKMSKFLCYNNTNSSNGNPATALDYYYYMRGFWKNGAVMKYGGDGYLGGLGITNDTCNFMYPGDSDPAHWGTDGQPEVLWDEATAGNVPGDRRFIQSCGPFTMQPGSVYCITTAVIWARASSAGTLASVAELKHADDEIQQYFNSCFTSFPVSVNELTVSGSWNVYPNPFHDFTTIRFPVSNKQFSVNLVLYNDQGKLVRTYEHISSHELVIRRENLNSGIYFYKISGEKNTPKSGKLIIID